MQNKKLAQTAFFSKSKLVQKQLKSVLMPKNKTTFNPMKNAAGKQANKLDGYHPCFCWSTLLFPIHLWHQSILLALLFRRDPHSPHTTACRFSTVWKFHDFSIIQILREIKFGDSTSAKSAILTHSEFPNFALYEILHFLKAEICQTNKIQGLRNDKNGNFRTSISLKIDFT